MSGKKLALADNDKKIAGVCGGIAKFFGIDSTIVRIIAVIFTLAGGAGILLYILGWILMPHISDNF
jgi:phage shock protein C